MIHIIDTAANQYENGIDHLMTWNDFKAVMPTHPLEGIASIAYQPDDGIYHAHYKTGEVVAVDNPQNEPSLKWFDDNLVAIRQVVVDDIIAKDPIMADFYNVDINNI